MKKIAVSLLIVGLLMSAHSGAAAEDRFEARIERGRVSVGNPLYLYLTFKGVQNVSRPKVPDVNGVKIKFVGPSTEMSIVNGVVSQSVTFTYLVIPMKEGRYNLGPFFLTYQGQSYRADAVTLIASDQPAPASSSSGRTSYSASGGSAPSGGSVPYVSDRIFLTMETGSRTMYINEVVPLIIKVYVNNMGLRDIEYPYYEHEGFSTGEFDKPLRRTERFKGVSYDLLVFRQEIFGIKEGKYTLGPARLSCKMVVRRNVGNRSSLFSIFDDDSLSNRFGFKTYPIELESDAIPVIILPFPEENKPAYFHGAVGDFDMDVNVSPRKVKVGDPITVRISISGRGNLDTVTAPQIETDENIKIYEPQVTKKGNKKIYELILIPKNTKVKETPAVNFSFFDPTRKKYKTITKAPVAIEVLEQPESQRAVKMVSMAGESHMFYPQEKLGEDIVHIKENIGKLTERGKYLCNNGMFLGAQAVPLLLLIGFFVTYRRKERMMTDKSYARFLKAPRKARSGMAKAKAYLRKGETAPFYDTIFKTLQSYLSGRFALPKGNVTTRVVEERLKPAGCDEKILEMLKEVFQRCEMARYASSAFGEDDAEDILDKVKRIIDYMEKVRI
ncbi:MAG: BatD family protein [Candidatus Tantalella remota]|nr:BatD family protein [Candidatus Tantalella remota]